MGQWATGGFADCACACAATLPHKAAQTQAAFIYPPYGHGKEQNLPRAEFLRWPGGAIMPFFSAHNGSSCTGVAGEKLPNDFLRHMCCV